MGYNTTVFILNDGFDQLEKDPEAFVRAIQRNMHDGGTAGIGCYVNNVTVMKSEHADVPRLYLTHQNSIIELDLFARQTDALLMSTLYGRRWVKDCVAMAKRKIKDLEKHIAEIEQRYPMEET